MEKLYLIKIGEIALKGQNKSFFEKKLRNNIKKNLSGIDCTFTGRQGRYYIEADKQHAASVEDVLSRTFGIVGYSEVRRVSKEIEEIRAVVIQAAENFLAKGRGKSFKIETRRTDKGFPLSSYEISCLLGDSILDKFEGTRVDVKNPDWVVHVEIREMAFIYGDVKKGPGGLPVGCAGGGMLLLSGGIDSPVAGYLMAKRGLKLDAVYFHTYPYTSDEAKKKVEDLAAIVSRYCCGINLFVVPFTNVQLKIKEKGPEKATTLLMRHAMVKIADILAKERGDLCMITGEALSQVASQTPESIRFTGSATDLPIFRPLIGMDKEEIVAIAERIGTFETSILPFDDCCAMFSPEHPMTHPNFERTLRDFDKLELDELLEQAAAGTERLHFNGETK